MRTTIGALLVMGLLAAACGGSSLSAYAEEVEELVDVMNDRLTALNEELGEAPGLDELKRITRARADARRTFVEGLERLHPPSNAEELHDAALEVMGGLASAETAVAELTESLTTNIGINAIMLTSEGRALAEADQRALALCVAAQEQFDETRDARDLDEAPWIPREMKDIVEVAFGCDS